MKKTLRTRMLKVLAVTPLLAMTQIHAGLVGASFGAMSDSFPKKGMEKNEAEILVRFKAGVADSAKAAKHAAEGNQVIRDITRFNIQQLRISPAQPVADAVANYRADPNVEFAEPNYVLRALAIPNEPAFPQMWGLRNDGSLNLPGFVAPFPDIRATTAWDRGTGSTDVVVLVIDSGIDYTHCDLDESSPVCAKPVPRSNIWTNPGEIPGNGIDDDLNGYVDDVHGYNTVANNGDPMDDYGHGTHVAGTIGALGNNSLGYVGVNWNVKIAACKALDSAGRGTMDRVIRCMAYAKALKDKGVNVVVTNNSYGGLSTDPDPEVGMTPERIATLGAAIEGMSDILFVAASGNSALDNDVVDFLPADYALPNMVSVAATDRNDDLAKDDQNKYFSNTGRRSVHLGAPGRDIVSTIPFNLYTSAFGTSMASPHVAGVAALIKSQNPALTTNQIKNLILSGGDPIPALQGKTITGRRLNADTATACVNKPFLSALKLPAAFTVGVANTISAISINCSAAVGPVTAVTAVGGNILQTVNLLDDGVAPDQKAGDGEFTATWTPNANFATITFSSDAGSEVVNAVDLVMTAVSGPTAANLGDTISVNVGITNPGTSQAAVPASTANVYLSTDANITTADILLTTVGVPGIPAGTQRDVVASALLPTTLAAGTYFIGAIADPANQITEGNEANNALAGNQIVISNPAPDLTVNASVSIPATGVLGNAVTVSATVANIGTGPAAASTLSFYLSTDATITSADRLVGTAAINALAAGATQLASGSVTLPADLAAGTYFIGAIADSANVVLEGNEANNARAGNTTVLSNPSRDLTLTAVGMSTTTSRNAPAITMTATLRNTGTLAAPIGTKLRWYLSTDTVFSADDRALTPDASTTSVLNGGSTRSMSISTRIPVDVPAGSYYVIGVADPDNLVSETNNANNTRTTTSRITVSYTIDLTMTAVSAPAAAATGQNVTFTGTIRNAGAAAAGSTVVNFYLSTDSSISTNDRLIASTTVASVAAGASVAVSATAALRTDLPAGTYYIGVIADPANLVSESNNNNNSFANATARMVTSYGPDMVINAVTAPATATRGTVVAVSGTLQNLGVGAVGAATDRRVIESGSSVTVGIYLSTNTNITTFDTLVGTYTFSSLAAGASQPFTVNVTIPAGMALGNYYIGAIADRGAVVRESNEVNNSLPGNLVSVR